MTDGRTIEIAGRRIGDGEAVWIVAELGVNHCGDPVLATRMVEAARACGADAVKVQVFSTDRLVAAGTPAAAYQEAVGDARAILEPLELDAAAFQRIRLRAREAELAFIASPFDDPSLELVASLGPDAIKIASGELVTPGAVEQAARLGVPVLVSTGMATLQEIDGAHAILEAAGAPHALLHCVSAYPTPPDEANLRAITSLRERYPVPVGYSDHTDGVGAASLAVALGASLIEKHFTLDRSLPGPDHRISADPDLIRALVAGVRGTEAMLGSGEKTPQPAEREAACLARKSVYASRVIPAGKTIEAEDLALLRPAAGIPARDREALLGRPAAREIAAGAAILWEDVAG